MKTAQTKNDGNRLEHNRRKIESYPIQISVLAEEDGGGFQAVFPPLARSVVGYGTTPQEAIADLHVMVPVFLEMLEETEQTLPLVAAQKDWDDFSGKFNVRVAKALHAQLVQLADDQGVSLNSLVQTILTSGATALAAGKMFGAVERTITASRARAVLHWDFKEDGSCSEVAATASPADQDYDLAAHLLARERNKDHWQMAQGG